MSAGLGDPVTGDVLGIAFVVDHDAVLACAVHLVSGDILPLGAEGQGDAGVGRAGDGVPLGLPDL